MSDVAHDGNGAALHDSQPVAGPSAVARSATPASAHPPQDPGEGVVMTHELKSTFNRAVNRKMLNQYEFDHKVGRGQHGEVFLARDTSRGGMEVAIKAVKRKNPKVDRMSMLRKRNLPQSRDHARLNDDLGSTEHKIRKEIAIMKKCRHPHVVRLLEVVDDRLNERIYMVMEYLGGGEIKWRTQADEPVLRVDQTRRICRDVILGLEYLHHQGIIHRDIKPANLLWTADRRTVKITDFGVSHFSYAQRLAAAGTGLSLDDEDPILLDESDLSKTAGTPTFLAPEIVSDCTNDSSGSSMTLSARKKPPITKAIDIWAFGVTLYGLLFGHLPFQAQSEYEIYRVIRRMDWDVAATMGVDRIPVGGRHQRPLPKGEETDGYLVVKLLGRLLEKDARKRISLDMVKRDPWILRDISDPEAWLRDTQIDIRQPLLEPTPDETSSAMSAVRFQWSARIGQRISSLWRSVRPQRSFRRREDDDTQVGVRSAPHMHQLTRHSTTPGPYRPKRSERRGEGDLADRPISRQVGREASRNQSVSDLSSRSIRSFEPWSIWGAGSTLQPVRPPSIKVRRSSVAHRPTDMTLQVPASARSYRVGSPLPSPMAMSAVSSPGSEQSPDDRPRSRLSMSSFFRWASGGISSKPTSAGTSPLEVSASPSAQTTPPASVRRATSGAVRRRMARRSEDAFHAHAASRHSSGSGPMGLTVAMRAASWGEVRDYARPSEDLTSIYSGDRANDELDEDTLMLGAGGVAQSPVPSIPSGLLSTVSSLGSAASPTATTAAAISAAQAILQRSEASEHPPDSQDMSRRSFTRLRNTAGSPLSQTPFIVQQVTRSRSRSSAVSYTDDSSIFDEEEHDELDDGEVELQPSTSQMYQDEDESDDDEAFHLEVRTRRPSASAHSPVRAESAHRSLISCN